MRQAALIMVNDQVDEHSVRVVNLIRHVAYATDLNVVAGPAILAVFDKDMPEDDFQLVMLPALRALRFTVSVESAPGSYRGHDARVRHVGAIIDFTLDLLPGKPHHPSGGELADYVSELREWARTREILLGEACGRIKHGDRDKL